MEGIAVGTAVAIGVSEVGEGAIGVGEDSAGVGEELMGVGEAAMGVAVSVLVAVGVDCVPTWTGGPTIFGRSKTFSPSRISTEGSYVPGEEYGCVVRGTAVHSTREPSAKSKPYWRFEAAGGGRRKRSSNRTS